MAVIRLKPTRYSASYPSLGKVQNPESIINGLNPEDASSTSTYAAIQSGRSGSYGPVRKNYITMHFDIPNNISIKKITVKARMASYNTDRGAGYIEIPLESNRTAKLEGQCYIWSNPSYARNYMAGGTSNYSQYEVGESYLPYFIERVTTDDLYFYSGEVVAPITYISGVVLDVEYDDPIKNSIKIGTKSFNSGFVGIDNWITKIYKGATLLFSQDKEKPLPKAYKQLRYIQGTGNFTKGPDIN